ncbi:hypothetical protein LCGC14_2665010 [marine sediment metagenome]|uniref:Class I SAM-dependent methyltransferase n=1 Tax=marine sediment metagenome TaxID=412755 RepID=A0A0F8ZQU0_9ZZZZ
MRENNIKGWMSEKELEFLHDSAKDLDVVELGSYLGRSTVALAESAKTVSAVDHWNWKGDGLLMDGTEYDKFRENIDEYDNIAIYQMSTLEAAKAMIWKPDMVFIDADHSYEAVKADIETWLPKTKQLICGHDYDFDEVKLKPLLAESYEVSDDGLEISFRIRDDVHFSDRHPIIFLGHSLDPPPVPPCVRLGGQTLPPGK